MANFVVYLNFENETNKQIQERLNSQLSQLSDLDAFQGFHIEPLSVYLELHGLKENTNG